MLTIHRPLLVASSLVVALSGCTEALPPPEAPSQQISADLTRRARESTPEATRGIVVLDAVGGSARVDEPDGAGETCAETPCVAVLSRGEHRLVFHRDGRDDEVSLNVTERPTAYRRVMSYDTGAHEEYTALAAIGLALGGLTLGPLIPVLTTVDGQGTAEEAALIVAGVASSALLVTGIVGLVLTITNPQQTREGVGVQWPLELD